MCIRHNIISDYTLSQLLHPVVLSLSCEPYSTLGLQDNKQQLIASVGHCTRWQAQHAFAAEIRQVRLLVQSEALPNTLTDNSACRMVYVAGETTESSLEAWPSSRPLLKVKLPS